MSDYLSAKTKMFVLDFFGPGRIRFFWGEFPPQSYLGPQAGKEGPDLELFILARQGGLMRKEV
jgi:hypothetical protein